MTLSWKTQKLSPLIYGSLFNIFRTRPVACIAIKPILLFFLKLYYKNTLKINKKSHTKINQV